MLIGHWDIFSGEMSIQTFCPLFVWEIQVWFSCVKDIAAIIITRRQKPHACFYTGALWGGLTEPFSSYHLERLPSSPLSKAFLMTLLWSQSDN